MYVSIQLFLENVLGKLWNVMGKVIKIITLGTFQMVMVRIYDAPNCTLKVMFILSCRRRNSAGCYSY